LSYHATLGGATEQYCHTNGSGMTVFSTSGTLSNVMDVVAPMHVARQRKKILEAIIIETLNKK
jgi:hypothetical protein